MNRRKHDAQCLYLKPPKENPDLNSYKIIDEKGELQGLFSAFSDEEAKEYFSESFKKVGWSFERRVF